MQTIVVVFAALAVAFGGTSAPPTSGLRGQVREGPITPVCRSDIPCDRPAADTALYFWRNGKRVRTVLTDAHGNYTALLPAGVYSVRSSRGIRRIPAPARVKVRRDHVDHLDFFIDTGIR